MTIAGLGLYSYYVRELMTALTLFSIAFFFLALVLLGALLVWCVSVQVAIWARPASRTMVAFSRRLIASLRQALSRQGISKRDSQLCTSEQTREAASSRIVVVGMQCLCGAERRFFDDRG